MNRKSLLSGEDFSISDRELEYCRQNGMPLPEITPRERMRAMLIFRNRVHLSRATCALTGKSMLSSFPAGTDYTVADVEAWGSDSWDPLSFGKPYDFSRSFFDQYGALLKSVPIPNLAVVRATMENSDYTNGITSAKNCYLIFSSLNNEECLYSKSLWRCYRAIDCIYAHDCRECYRCRNVVNCQNLYFSDHCSQCSESYFLYNCQSCRNCYRCANLVNRQYCFENQQLTRDEFERRLREIDLGGASTVARETESFLGFTAKFPIKFYFGRNNENSTGNFLLNTKNCLESYFISNSEDVEHCIYLEKSKNCMLQVMFGNHAELVYNSLSCGDDVFNLKFCNDCWVGSSNLEYCTYCCYGTSDCFGCVGVKKKSYCILNKQYEKDEYFELTARIRKQMLQHGEYGWFFPASLSPHCYNKSDAFDYFPLSESEAQGFGYRWDSEEAEQTAGPGASPPDHIKDAGEALLSQTLSCSTTGKPFRIIKQELEFHRAHKLALPKEAPLERIKAASYFYQTKPLKAGPCSACRTTVESSLWDAGHPLLCEKCYLDQLY